MTVPTTYLIECNDGEYHDWEDKLKEVRMYGIFLSIMRMLFQYNYCNDSVIDDKEN